MQSIAFLWTDPVTGERVERSLRLPVSIGRDPENSLVLASSRVSARHAALREQQGRLIIDDLGSRAGVFVNGRQARQQEVKPGDVLTIGPYHLRLQADPADVRVRLSWVDPRTRQGREAVHRLPMTLGREPGCEVVLDDEQISRRHVQIALEGGQVVARDQGSRNGMAVGGQRVQAAALASGARLEVGPFALAVTVESAGQRRAQGAPTILFGDQRDSEREARAAAQEARAWPPAALNSPIVPAGILGQLGVPVATADYGAIGGGLGSFIWADNLIIGGVRPRQIVALGVNPRPYARYQRLCRNSQIPDHERLRSNSESTPDNIWGWPGYALREIWADLGAGRLGAAAHTFWQIFGEPSLAQTYTPRIGDVFRGIEREMGRIGWGQIFRHGRVRAIRKTDDGRYVVAYSFNEPPGRGLLVARHLHIAVGYPALQFLRDLQEYRERTGDFRSVVNAYEDHDYVYEQLRRSGGVVVLRGRGIVASRIIQRLYEERRYNPRIAVVHLMRTPNPEGNRFGRARREARAHFEFQPFNWPRACWSGDLRVMLERASPEQRKALLSDWGGTTTARRDDWVAIVDRGLAEGWYRIDFGEVRQVDRTPQGRLVVDVEGKSQVGGVLRYEADFVIDCTGLDAKAKANPLLRELIDTYNLPLNPMERLHVENDFEIPGLRNGPGRAYGAGSFTLGGPYAAVDSFLGLQYAAMRSVDSLAALRAPGLRRLGTFSSLGQWFKWMQGVSP